MPINGIRPVAASIHMAKPIPLPGSGSMLGMFRRANSLCNDFEMLTTTMKCQTKLNNGISISHTKPGDNVLDTGAHRSKVRWRVSR